MSKTYSVDVQNGELVSIKIDDATYYSPDDILDEGDRAHVEFLIKDAKDWELSKASFLVDAKPSRTPLVIFLLFLSIAILLFVISAVSAVNAIRSAGKEQSLPGRVVNMIERRGSDRHYYYYPEFEFTLPDGTTRKIQSAHGSWPPAFDIGQEVTVIYNSEHPSEATIQTSDSPVMRYLGTIITGFIGLGFLGAAMLARMFTKSTSAVEQPGESVSVV